MISKAEAWNQVRRFNGLNFFSIIDEQGIAELVEAFRSAENEAAAIAAANDWLRNRTERPTPADIYVLLSGNKPPRICRRCGGTGLVLRRAPHPEGRYRHVLACCGCTDGSSSHAAMWAGTLIHDEDWPAVPA